MSFDEKSNRNIEEVDKLKKSLESVMKKTKNDLLEEIVSNITKISKFEEKEIKNLDEIEKFKRNIEKVMKEKRYDLLEEIASGITEISKKVYFITIFEILKSINLEYKEKILFYIKIIGCKNTSPTIKNDLMPLLINSFIDSNKEVFLNLLDNNEFVCEFLIWLKEGMFEEKNLDDRILNKILSIPKIQKEILTNPNFYTKHNSFKLFNSLPIECSASIAFYSNTRNNDFERNLKHLYSKYFGSILDRKEQLELVKEHIIELKKSDIFELGLVKMEPFYYFLNCVLRDKNYFVYIEKMKKNSGLNFNTILKFLYKYDKTNFFEKLCETDKSYTEDITRKIEYLSIENRLIDANKIYDLNNISFDKIKTLDKEKSNDIVLKVAGGPRGTDGKIFSDGYEREIRRIDLDGSKFIFNVENSSHEFAVELTYPNIKFDKNCTMAIERAIEAAKQISSITFIIEKEACYIVSNNKLSQEQIKALSNLKVIKGNNTKFGIITYDSNSNTSTLAYDGESMTFDEMIKYMSSLNIKKKTR